MKVEFKKVKIFVTIPTEDVDKVRGAVCLNQMKMRTHILAQKTI